MSGDHTDDIKALYDSAFRDFGSVALWNVHPKQYPDPG